MITLLLLLFCNIFFFFNFQIDKDLITKSDVLLNQCVELDKPGFAQHYCLHCAKYCIDERSLKEHFKTKVHKRRMKALEKEPYSHAEAERAAGHGSYIEPKERVMETQPSKEEYKQGKRVKIELKPEKDMEIEIVED